MKASLLLIILCFSFLAQSQSIKRSSIGSIGNSSNSKSIKLSQSIGQNSVHEKIENKGVILRQGFQQPESRTSNKVSNKIDMHIFPNPNEGNFTAILGLARDENFNYTITDSQGRIIQESVKTNTIENDFSFHASTQKGTYVLRITTKDGKFGQAKIVVL